MKLLLLINTPPSPGFSLKDSLDVALTSAVFGQHVSLLLMGAGAEHLQAAADNGLGELADYGIDELYTQQQALEELPLNIADVAPATHSLDETQIGILLASQHCVLHF